MTIQERRLELLEETIKHFNSTNRCVNALYRCVYSPVKGISTGCAIGRLIEDKELCKSFDELRAGVSYDYIFGKLPLKLQKLGQPFLINLQHLHDLGSYWTENGLSKEGEDCVKRIKIKHNL